MMHAPLRRRGWAAIENRSTNERPRSNPTKRSLYGIRGLPDTATDGVLVMLIPPGTEQPADLSHLSQAELLGKTTLVGVVAVPGGVACR
jgi:hypothetical protein